MGTSAGPRAKISGRAAKFDQYVGESSCELSASKCVAQFEISTFGWRAVRIKASRLPAPPPAWVAPYARMVAEDELRWADLATLARAVEAS